MTLQGVDLTFTTVSDTLLTVTVPAGATTGPLRLDATGGPWAQRGVAAMTFAAYATSTVGVARGPT